MIFENLIHDKSYLIMKGGTVYTFCRTRNTDDGKKILVYDRNELCGLNLVQEEDIELVLTEYSEEYNNELEELLIFISRDLKTKPLLRRYILAIWAGDGETAEKCAEEDISLVEQFIFYMEDLIEKERYQNLSVVRYFNAVFCEQELIYPKYNDSWLKYHLSA